jgi:ribonuclease HI
MIYCDGFSNNKESGYTVCDQDGNVLVREVFPYRRTNNEAELRGVLAAVQLATDFVVTDSQCVTLWVKAGKCAARPDLTPIAAEVRRLLKGRGVRLVWQPREQNKAGMFNEQVA